MFESSLTFWKVKFLVFTAEYIYVLNNAIPQKAVGRRVPVLMGLAAGNAALSKQSCSAIQFITEMFHRFNLSFKSGPLVVLAKFSYFQYVA